MFTTTPGAPGRLETGSKKPPSNRSNAAPPSATRRTVMSTASHRSYRTANASSYKLLEARPTSSLIEATSVLGRVLLMVLFVMSGIAKLGDYPGTLHSMAEHGVPGFLLP